MEALDQHYVWRPTVAGEREMYAAALTRLAAYPRTAEGEVNPDAAWDQVLDEIDAILIAREAAHRSATRVRDSHG